jgi:hypothetical protein
MSDPHLSTLCRICLACPPKYTCPRCGVRTCSLSCVQKHKARAACSGERDPTKYVPAKELRTEAGFDHDFNFLRRIERAQERAVHDIIEERALVGESQLHPQNEDKVFDSVWYGDELRHVRLDAHGPPGKDGPDLVEGFEKHVRRRIRMLNIEVRKMPKGMKRQQENKTGWNRKSLSINWQVEWIIYHADQPNEPTRLLHKVLDRKPLNYGLAMSLEWQKAGERKRTLEEAELADNAGEPPRKKHRKRKAYMAPEPSSQDWSGLTWPESECTMQSYHTAQWDQTFSSSSAPPVPDDEAFEFAKWQFFLKKDGNPKLLIPLASTESLEAALTGRTIIEFPTIYVLPPSLPLPDGFVLGSRERRAPKIVEVADEGDQKLGSDRRRYQHESTQFSERRQGNQWQTRGGRGHARRGGPIRGG